LGIRDKFTGMSTPIKLAVHGAAGRMGRRVIALAAENSSFRVVGAIEDAKCPLLGQDAGAVAGFAPIDVALLDHWPDDLDVVVDFSLPGAVDVCLAKCVEKNIPLVVATTGLTPQQKQSLTEAAASIPIVWAPSMSLAVNLAMKLSQQITQTLKDVEGGLDIEILERHHRFKVDAPSGTALRFGELIAEKLEGEIKHVHGRIGETGQRTRAEIGYHAIRVGDNPGEHTIVFGMMGERIELTVAASNRDCYASGALAAAKWLMDKPNGLYNMFDVLGLS
jgi:4-hydroxy-tetrahydrodipicolinate reductase